MKIETVRKVDYWVGIPVCFLLTLWDRVRRMIFPRPGERPPPKKFLFIELSEMGSAILAYPAMKAIQREYPGAELFFMIFAKNRASVDILNLVPRENVLTIREKSLGSFLGDVLKNISRMHREGLDVVFDLELFTRVTAILTYLSGAPVRVGFHKYLMEGLYRGNLHTHKVQYNFQQHIAKSFLSFLDVLRYPAKDWPAMDAAIEDGRLEPAIVPGLGNGSEPDQGQDKKPFPRAQGVRSDCYFKPQCRGNPHPGLAPGQLCGTGPPAAPGPQSGAGPDGGRSRQDNHRSVGGKDSKRALRQPGG